jgi:hypothetical protein
MKWSIGILVAPRPVPSVGKTLASIRASWDDVIPYCFAEPGCTKELDGEICKDVLRPSILDDGTQYKCSPEGRFGNFQNWLQSAADLVQASVWAENSDNDAVMICEDDAQLTEGIREYIESCLWPSEDCGVVSLYCPPLTQYRSGSPGLVKTKIVHSGATLTPRSNLVGALALIFPRKVLAELINHPSQDTWGGSHAQARSGVNPWERKAVDTWIGRALLEMGRTCWHFVPSLVNHYSPDSNVSNSSMGNGFNRDRRQARGWMPVLSAGRMSRPKQVFEEVR